MSNASEYENNNNPLTEVALALAMAFFSIMILSIFALSNASINNKKEISIINNANNKNDKKNSRLPIYFYKDKFYNAQLEVIETNQLLPKKKYLLFISTDISVEKLFSIKSLMGSKDVKVSRMLMETKSIFKSKVIRKQ